MNYFVKQFVVSISMLLFAVSAYASGAPSGASASGAPASAIVPINLSKNCHGGGTRVSTGTYDSSSGALTWTTTLTNCVDASNTTHNGTVAVPGSISPTTSGYSSNLF